MGRSFKKIPSIKPQKPNCYKKGTSIVLPEVSYKKIVEKFKKHCLKEYETRV